MESVMRLGLPFKLDQLTEGLGNCFPVAISQQLRRPEIFSQLNLTNKMLLGHKTPRGKYIPNSRQKVTGRIKVNLMSPVEFL